MLKRTIEKADYFGFHHLKDHLVKKLALAMIGLNDPYTAAHIEEVAEIAGKIGVKLGLNNDRLENLTLAGFLHDIDKQAIPNSILSKPTKLTNEEYALVKTHVDVGVQLLKYAEVSPQIIRIVEEHHERLDGSGYPKGLKGNQISLEGQIIGVADVMSALTSKRTYRTAATKEEVTKILLNSCPHKFNRRVVDAALDCLDSLY
ncbi:MAG: HD-GYP domain-containing protein [Kordiimonadaceae bacterium]|nr:HD-GYP domain-containing protein [Kordiimonadaceae bacterium]